VKESSMPARKYSDTLFPPKKNRFGTGAGSTCEPVCFSTD